MELPYIEKPFFEVRTLDGMLTQTVESIDDIKFQSFIALNAGWIMVDFSVDKRIAELFPPEQNYLLRHQIFLKDGGLLSWNGKDKVKEVPFDNNVLEEIFDAMPGACEAGDLRIVDTGAVLNDIELVKETVAKYRYYFSLQKKEEELGWGTAIAGVAAAALFGVLAGKSKVAKPKDKIKTEEDVNERQESA